MAYQYQREVVLRQIHNVIRWLQSKADKAGSETTQVSGLDCKVAADMVAGLLAEHDRLRAREQALAAENEQKQAQIDAVRPVVEAVARMTATTGNGHCDSCNGQRVMIYDAKRYTQHISDDYEHAADCPIAQARAFVAAHPATATATTAGEAESEGE